MPYQLRDGPSFQLLLCAGKLKKHLEQALRPFNITPVQFAVLGLLWESDDLLQHEIADLLGKDRPNISRVLEKMALKGLIIRHQDTQDRRATRVTLTNSARILRPTLEQLGIKFRTQATHGLSETEQKQLINLLNRLLENLA